MPLNIKRRDLLRSGAVGAVALGTGTGVAAAGGPPARIVGTSTEKATREAREKADSVKRTLDFGSIGKAVAGRFSDRAAQQLRQRDDVRYVEEDGTMHAIAQTLPWGIDRVDAEKVHADGETGGDNTDGEDGADIAIIDTGIDDDHPDLQANVGKGKAYVGCRGPNCNYSWSDDNDHGTHCAGISDAVNNGKGVVGVSTEATLHAVKVLDKRGSGSFSDVAAGIEYVADQGWDVGSLSLGADSGAQTVKDACTYAYNKGVLLVASAGNEGPCTDCVGYPAAYSECIAVSSTDSDDSLSSFSSTGPEVELAAPGGSIYSTVIDGYDTFSGTSMSCPHVSGAGGQLMDNGYTNTEARDQLKSTAEDLGLAPEEQGKGLLDVDAAVGSSSSDPSPTVDSLSASEVETSDGDAEFDVSWSVSDDEGDLSSVDVYLLDSSSNTEDSVTGISVSGSSASGTNRLVASGDEGTGDSYTVELTVTDSNSNSTTSSVSATESEDAPTVDSLSASEVETSDGDAEFDVSWAVSDADGDLDTLTLTLTQDSDGSQEDQVSPSVAGDSASGTARLVASGDDGTGNSYTVSATVTDTDGTSGSGSTSVSETESTNSAPTVGSLSLSEDNHGGSPHADFDASWSVSDSDGDLDTVDLTLIDLDDGETEDSASVDVSGGSASGTADLAAKHEENSGHEYEVELVVTDTSGSSNSSTATEVEDGS